jgi:glycosyltransferase involved in cell wall biosynthesis
MRTAVVIDRLNVGGVEKIAIEQVRALRALGKDAELVILRRKGVVAKAFPDLLKEIPVVYLDDRLPSWARWSTKFPFFHFFESFHLTYPFVLPFVVKNHEWDYFIVHGTYTCFSALTLKKARSIPFSGFIWDPIGYILERVYKTQIPSPLFSVLKAVANVLDTWIITGSDVILVGGAAHNDYFKRVDPKVQITSIPPSVHLTPLKKMKKHAEVLMVTAWKRGKHPEYIFELLAALPKLKIAMVGKWLEDEYLQEFSAAMKDAKVQDRVRIVGAVSESELGEYYQRSLVLLQTNDDRGFGMPALEAAAHQTTFIIPEGQGVCELFKNGTDGFYTKERDTKTIVKHLKTLIDHPEQAKQMGFIAWEKVKANYSWENHAKLLWKVMAAQRKRHA